MIEILQQKEDHLIVANGKPCGKILGCAGAADAFEPIENGAWRWHRRTAKPVDHMRMEVLLLGEATFTMVPAVSYNGNGWGDVLEYVGDRDVCGTPWSWASHRVTIPACTYSENSAVSIALMAEANSNSACSLYKVDEGEKHVVIFPEEEQPRTLQRHFWGEPFQGAMEPRQDFEAILQVVSSDGSAHRYKHLMDFAFRYYGHKMDAPRTAEDLHHLSIAFSRFLFQRERNGFAAFTSGAQWHTNITGYKKQEHRYQLGWVGQSASMANAMIDLYLHKGEKQDLDMALEVHDAWLKFGQPMKGLLNNRIDYHPYQYLDFENLTIDDIDPWDYGDDLYELIINMVGTPVRKHSDGTRYYTNDACNLGTGADCYFEAYELLQKAGIDKPEYQQAAFDVCEFAMKNQDENGSFAKSWDDEGVVSSKTGTIGCFLCLPLVKAYQITGDRKYLDSAARAFWFYYGELEEKGFTTAGALDTYSIDKESASPLLRVCLRLYDATNDPRYIAAGEKIGWYLATWMMYFTVEYPEDCLIAQMGYDTFGSTSVSTPHNALDQYALRDVLSFKKLSELTGNVQWRERALALWCNASQCISDGTLYINGRLRPAGGQDEAIFHTRWGRRRIPPFTPSQWLPAWPCAFRLEALRWHEDWSFFDEGLQHIAGKIEK